jgi:hypothetical protein
MKTALCLALLCVGQLMLSAAETAYNALRVVGKQNGADVLNRVVEVRGRSGTPNPSSWKIVLNDPGARGGIRELEVQGGKIISERTPVTRSTGTPIDFNQLNLDSEGALTVVNQETQKARLSFDRIDYILQAGSAGPQWHLELYEHGEKIGYLDVSAESGNVVHRDLAGRASAPPPPPVVDRYAREHRVPPPAPNYVERRDRRDDYADDRDYLRDDDDYDRRPHRSFPEKVQNHFEKRAAQIKRFFMGD